MGRHSRRHQTDQLPWPPEPDDDIEVMDLQAPSTAPPPLHAFPRSARAKGVRLHFPLPRWGGRGGWLLLERAGLVILAGIVLAQAAFILSGGRPSSVPVASAPTRTARRDGLVGTSGTSMTAVTRSPTASLSPAGAASATGRLLVGTLPAGAAVSLDGERLGLAPVTVPQLQAGQHTVVIQGRGRTIRQQVLIAAGETVSLLVLTTPAEMPRQRLAITAVPWAEVWIDGRWVGETPTGRLSLPLGPHLLLFHHPQLGDKTVRTVLRADAPARINMDMRK
jgi:hypothetical protein